MEDVILDSVPELRRPLMIMAYHGWNDAGAAASHAVEYLVEHLGAEQFGSVDPEEYYDFTQARPYTRPLGEYSRELTWPRNDFYFSGQGSGRDLVFFVGTEPHLRWRRYGKNLVDLAKQLGITEAFALGALIADTPHTHPVPLSGGSSTPDLAERLRGLGIGGSRYEGPTGILSVVGTMLAEVGIPNGSMWAAVPHYISATPNPKAASALLRKLNAVFSLDISVAGIDAEAQEYEAQVETAISSNPEAQEYVRDLELHTMASPDEPDLDTPPDDGTVEPLDASQAEGLIRSVEEYLRRQREQGGQDDLRG